MSGVVTTEELQHVASETIHYWDSEYVDVVDVPVPVMPTGQRVPKELMAVVGKFTFDPQAVHVIDDVTLGGPVGVMFTNTGRVVLESAYTGRVDVMDRNKHNTHRAHQAIDHMNYTTSEWTLPLAGAWGGFYFHWITEFLTKLQGYAMWQKSHPMEPPILVAMNSPLFQIESLLTFGFERDKIIRLHPHMKVKHAIIPTVARRGGRTSPRAIQWLRDEYRSRCYSATYPGAIYISRSDTNNRRIVNESELFSQLLPYGFKAITLTGVPIVDQVRTFSNASAIVAPHGSGLTNMVWASPGTPVIEIMDDEYKNPCFQTLAAALGHPYGLVIAKKEDRDMKVNPKDVLDVINRLAPQLKC